MSRHLRIAQYLVEFSHRVGSSMDWRDQRVMVYSEDRKLGEVAGGKLYHGTTAEFSPGDLLEPQSRKNFSQSGTGVSITSNLGRAKYWAKEVAKKNKATPHVYEVEPLGEVLPWRVQMENEGKDIVLWEGRVARAKILGEVGVTLR